MQGLFRQPVLANVSAINCCCNVKNQENFRVYPPGTLFLTLHSCCSFFTAHRRIIIALPKFVEVFIDQPSIEPCSQAPSLTPVDE